MTQEEREKLLKALAKRAKKALKNKKSAIRYLIEIGYLTKKGNVRKPYRTPKD